MSKKHSNSTKWVLFDIFTCHFKILFLLKLKQICNYTL